MNSRLEKLRQALDSALEGMSSEDLTRHPPEKWCAAEVLEHLYLTYTGTVKGFERVLSAGKPLIQPATMRQRLRALVVVGVGHMPEGRKSPAVALPRGIPAEEVRARLGQKLRAMDEIITRCESQMGSSKKLLDHPILGPLTAAQWRKFHLVHGLHHVKQLRRLKQTRNER